MTALDAGFLVGQCIEKAVIAAEAGIADRSNTNIDETLEQFELDTRLSGNNETRQTDKTACIMHTVQNVLDRHNVFCASSSMPRIDSIR